MLPDDIFRTLCEALRLAETGQFQDSWDLIETLPFEARLKEEALTVRITVCTGLEHWNLGRNFAQLITDGHELASRRAAGEFLLAYSKHLHASGFRNAARSCLETLLHIWPEGRDCAIQAEGTKEDGTEKDAPT